MDTSHDNRAQGQGARLEHGLNTPEPTPGPDQARNEADKRRREAELRGPGDGHSEVDDDDESEDEVGEPTQEQIAAVTRISKIKAEDFDKILGLENQYENEIEKKKAVLAAFRELGKLTHPVTNRHNKAGKAFKICKAAEHLDIDEDDLKEMKTWDGEENILNYTLNQYGHAQYEDDAEMEIDLSPTVHHVEIFQSCEAILSVLMEDPSNSDAIAALQSMNEKIKELNRTNHYPEDVFVIDWEYYQSVFRESLPHSRAWYDRGDEGGKAKLQEVNEKLRKYNADHKLPETWVMTIREPKVRPSTSGTNDGSTRVDEDGITRGNDNGSTRINEEGLIRGSTRPRSKGPQDRSVAKVSTSGIKYLKMAQPAGYVRDQGIQKKIVGYITMGKISNREILHGDDPPRSKRRQRDGKRYRDLVGHRLLLESEGKNNLNIYELVKASAFGKHFFQRRRHVLEGKELLFGSLQRLEDLDLQAADIAAVAHVRRYPENEPSGGWPSEPVTIVNLKKEDESDSEFRWYYRSSLVKECGREVTDEVLDYYRKKAGQQRPARRRKHRRMIPVASDDDDEGVISLGSGDSSSDESDVSSEDDRTSEEDEDDDEEAAAAAAAATAKEKRRKKSKGKSKVARRRRH
ncbi:hypothetical protein UCRPC4_g06983 [Phaeomoniella chlamydospora]|uniref:Uncharacterized protein n=1 Tax=Phaeomoniella chlamydospora TaxID=158046 RepID=A0A0G2FMQ9_PHACM|nr:hypothetical protein UCRPC4_g06983 [Phaeomoniella chlamydospora]